MLEGLIFAKQVVVDTTCPVDSIQALIDFFDLFNAEFLWLYPFSWSVVIVRKIFFV